MRRRDAEVTEMKLSILAAVLCSWSLIASAEAAVRAGEPVAETARAGCEVGRIDDAGLAPACPEAREQDDGALGAQLLVARYGDNASAFANTVAERYRNEHDEASARFWGHLAGEAAMLLKRR
jgi:hypothetical protein